MAPNMFGGVLLIRDSPCPESAWGEKAHACVMLLQKRRVVYLRPI